MMTEIPSPEAKLLQQQIEAMMQLMVAETELPANFRGYAVIPITWGFTTNQEELEMLFHDDKKTILVTDDLDIFDVIMNAYKATFLQLVQIDIDAGKTPEAILKYLPNLERKMNAAAEHERRHFETAQELTENALVYCEVTSVRNRGTPKISVGFRATVHADVDPNLPVRDKIDIYLQIAKAPKDVKHFGLSGGDREAIRGLYFVLLLSYLIPEQNLEFHKPKPYGEDDKAELTITFPLPFKRKVS